jgi:hypothetical protein
MKATLFSRILSVTADSENRPSEAGSLALTPTNSAVVTLFLFEAISILLASGANAQSTRFYLERNMAYVDTGNAKLGVDLNWGGAISELLLNGTNLVDRHDLGRCVQPALYDGNLKYGPGLHSWNPTLGGDTTMRPSHVSTRKIGPTEIYTQTQPLDWQPDQVQHRPTQARVVMEQHVSDVPGHPLAFKIHYRIAYFGQETRANALQETVAFVPIAFDRFVHSEGSPFYGEPLLSQTLTEQARDFWTPEKWAAMANQTGNGITMFAPEAYPYFRAGTHPGRTSSIRPLHIFTFRPGAALECDIYLIAGDVGQARQTVSQLSKELTQLDVLPPYGALDAPRDSAKVSGSVAVSGWAFDDSAGVAQVTVLMDDQPVGSAIMGQPRPDVQQKYPSAPLETGYSFMLDSTQFKNGTHTITVSATDRIGHLGIFPHHSVVITNPTH